MMSGIVWILERKNMEVVHGMILKERVSKEGGRFVNVVRLFVYFDSFI